MPLLDYPSKVDEMLQLQDVAQSYTSDLLGGKKKVFPVPGIEPGSFRYFRSDDMKAEYPSLWTIPEMVLFTCGSYSL